MNGIGLRAERRWDGWLGELAELCSARELSRAQSDIVGLAHDVVERVLIRQSSARFARYCEELGL